MIHRKKKRGENLFKKKKNENGPFFMAMLFQRVTYTKQCHVDRAECLSETSFHFLCALLPLKFAFQIHEILFAVLYINRPSFNRPKPYINIG